MRISDWKYQFSQYGVAIVANSFVFLVISAYIYFRRGYYNLYIINKAFAGTAIVILGIILLIGTLRRLFPKASRYIQYRKELGIIAFFLAVAHGIASFFFLPDKFSVVQFVGKGFWPFVFGVTATALLFLIFCISNDWIMKKIGKGLWWPLQYWGLRLTFLVILLHVFVMKWHGWFSWYKNGGEQYLARPEWPGGGLLVGWFALFVVLIRLSELGGQKFAKIIWYTSCIALPFVFVVTFWWGSQFAR